MNLTQAIYWDNYSRAKERRLTELSTTDKLAAIACAWLFSFSLSTFGFLAALKASYV